jgi:hypothetical protein
LKVLPLTTAALALLASCASHPPAQAPTPAPVAQTGGPQPPREEAARTSEQVIFAVDSISPPVGSIVTRASTFRAWIHYRIPGFAPSAWFTVVIFATTVPGQHISAMSRVEELPTLSDSVGTLLVEQKFDEVWAASRLRHPFELRVLLNRQTDRATSRSVVELGPYHYPVAP